MMLILETLVVAAPVLPPVAVLLRLFQPPLLVLSRRAA
jgi:hypothetical protein